MSAILCSRLLEGETCGIGCILSSAPYTGYTPDHRSTLHDPTVRIKDYIYVWDARGVNPKAKAVLLKGDLITQVDGKDVAGMRFEDVIDMIDGPEGTTVEITVKRKGEDSALIFNIARFIPTLNKDDHWIGVSDR